MTHSIRAIARCRWPDLEPALSQLRWYWCDLDGEHADAALPLEHPITTHLWGWAPRHWVRLRVDGEWVFGCELRKRTGEADGWRPAELADPVPARRLRPAGRAMPAASDWTVTLRRCTAPVEVTFIELTRL